MPPDHAVGQSPANVPFAASCGASGAGGDAASQDQDSD